MVAIRRYGKFAASQRCKHRRRIALPCSAASLRCISSLRRKVVESSAYFIGLFFGQASEVKAYRAAAWLFDHITPPLPMPVEYTAI